MSPTHGLLPWGKHEVKARRDIHGYLSTYKVPSKNTRVFL